MRDFVLYSRRGVTSPKFTLDDLPSSGGRMDLVARCVASALWLSRDIRRDTNFYAVLNGPPNPPVSLLFIGSTIRGVSPDERNVGAWIKKALQELEKAPERKQKDWVNVQDGVRVSRKSFQEVLRELKERPMYVLHEKGKDIREAELKENPVFILGDHMGLPKNEEAYANRAAEGKIKLGPQSYLASHCIALVHNEMDRRGL